MPTSKALLFQIVSYTTNFNCPAAYILINKSDATIQIELIRTILRSLHECNEVVRSIAEYGLQILQHLKI